MERLLITLSEEQKAKLANWAQEENLTINNFIKKRLFPEDFQSMDFYLASILAKTNELPKESEFTLKGILGFEAWTRLPQGLGLRLARQFKKLIDLNEVPNVKYLGKGNDKIAIYKKV